MTDTGGWGVGGWGVGKVALITGASRRIGRATALGLARAGCDVVVHAHSARDEIEAVAAEIRALGRRAHVEMGDVASEADVTRMVQGATTAFGRLDILVNNAAIRRQSPFLEMSYAEWREIMAVGLDAAFLCARAALPVMIAGGGGVIINIGGVSAHIGAIDRAHVGAAKSGLIGLTKALALEFADRGVRVNCVAPGKIGGERSASAGESPQMPGGTNIPLGRQGEVREAADIICMMCGPAASFMTGQTVHVNGGLYMP